jgi:Tol biopolymer transport system component
MTTIDVAETARASDLDAAVGQARATGLAWALVATSAWLIGGVYLDGWAHNHGKVDDSFFTPWHAVLYSGYGATAAVLVAAIARAPRGVWSSRLLPPGYGLSLVGVLVFAVAGFLDMLWHLAFGIEFDTASLLSPTHLGLALGAALIVSGPLRAAWLRFDGGPRSWSGWVTPLASLTFLYSLITFMTQFASPVAWPLASTDTTFISVGSDVSVMNADGGGQTRLARTSGVDTAQAAWSPDGKRLALTTWQNATHTGSLMLADVDGSHRTTVLDNQRRGPAFPAWSPEGRLIAFVSWQANQPEVFVVESDGSEPRRLTTSGVVPAPLSWSPDGARLALTLEREGTPWVHILELNTTTVTPLAEGTAPSWSPDGARIAFASARTGNGEIYSTELNGGSPRRLTRTTSTIVRDAWSWWPTYSPDGRQIAFQSNRGGTIDVFTMDADGQEPRNLTDNPSLDSMQPNWSADGRQIVFTTRGHTPDTSQSESMGVAEILLESIFLVSMLLIVARRWRVPFGGFTAVLTLNAILMSFQTDKFQFIPAAVLAGLVADVLLQRAAFESTLRLRLFAAVVPVVFIAAYFAALALTLGMGWTVHLWAGSIVLAGTAGWLLSYLVSPPAFKARPLHQPDTRLN